MLELISNPWPWYVSGASIAVVMLFMNFSGKTFGVSSNFETICTMCGAGRKIPFFKADWRSKWWNLLFIAGSIIGGLIGSTILASDQPPSISKATLDDLGALGLKSPEGMQPSEIFGWNELLTLEGLAIMVLGGFLVGFGTRYAAGCTSGHAISGLSNLQLPSLIAVIGFFIGGLFSTFVILPYLLG
jgi:hypothetical protein